MSDRHLAVERLREEIAYDPETGLAWWISKRPGVTQGMVIATTDSHGYLMVGVWNESYRLHRVIWALHHGEWLPADAHIDHINGNRSDNRIVNLRVATSSQNHANASKWLKGVSRGQSLYRGVGRRGKRWTAKVYDGDKSVLIGSFDTELEAAVAYMREAIRIYGEFATSTLYRTDEPHIVALREAVEALPPLTGDTVTKISYEEYIPDRTVMCIDRSVLRAFEILAERQGGGRAQVIMRRLLKDHVAHILAETEESA